MKKKILIVSNYFDPHQSGMVQYLKSQIKTFKKNNFKIYILTGNTNDKKKIEKIDNYIIIRSKISFNIGRGYISLSLIKDFFKVSKKMDIINFHFPLVEIIFMLFLSKKYKILNFHCLPPILRFNFLSIITNIYFNLSSFLSMLICNKIITHTNDYMKNVPFSKLFRDKIVEIFPKLEFKKNIIDNEYLIKNNETIKIGFLGRICREKGIENIINSSKLLSSSANIDYEFIIAGDLNDIRFKNYIHYIKKIALNNSKVKFIGRLNENQKSKFFEEIHILLLPSVNSFEAFGLVQLEAMSYGKLVISSNLRGVRIPIKITNNGIILSNTKPIDIFEGINKCIKMGLNKRKQDIFNTANNYFNIELFDKKYSLLFKEIKI